MFDFLLQLVILQQKKKCYRTNRTHQGRNPSHIIHSDSLKHALSVCNLFKYSLVSSNVEMHTYCYRRTQKACRVALKGWYAAVLSLPLGMLNSIAFPPLKTEETPKMYAHAQTHAGKQAPTFTRMFLCLKRIPNRAIRGPVDAFNPKGSCCSYLIVCEAANCFFSWVCV